jgi:hypothetical protein
VKNPIVQNVIGQPLLGKPIKKANLPPVIDRGFTTRTQPDKAVQEIEATRRICAMIVTWKRIEMEDSRHRPIRSNPLLLLLLLLHPNPLWNDQVRF